jgi:hypothetical protein
MRRRNDAMKGPFVTPDATKGSFVTPGSGEVR